ncbi:T9SS type A sorting domain-containing protein, partial [bacterium]|nr:T9SS type A sorting domain-containing protein [bacterium]
IGGNGIFKVFRINDLNDIEFVADYEFGGLFVKMIVESPYMYLILGGSRFLILDISDIDNIVELSRISIEIQHQIVFKEDNNIYGYVSYSDVLGMGYYIIINVEDPYHPFVSGKFINNFSNGFGKVADSNYAVGTTRNHDDIGTFTIFNCSPALSLPQRIPFSDNRFHLISPHVSPDSLTPHYLFRSVEHLQIAYQDNGSIYIPEVVDTIEELDLSKALKVFVSEADTLILPYQLDPDRGAIPTVDAEFIDPDTEYHVDANRWSWVGYPFPYPRPVQEALDFMYDEISIIMDDEGNFCIPNFVDTIEEFQPGQGYYVFSGFDWVFQYHVPDDVDPWEGFPFDDEEDGLNRATKNAFTEVQPTGRPYVVLVHPDETLQNLEPASIEVYDGETLVGASDWNNESDIHPVVCWQGFPEYGLVGFTPGNEIIARVLDSDGRIVGSSITKDERELITKDELRITNDLPQDHREARGSSQKLDSSHQNGVSSVFSVSSVVQSGSLFGEGPYAEVTVSASSTAEASLPGGFVLGTVYPNPFNSTLTVPFTLPAQREVRFQLFNTLGQLQFEQVGMYPSGQQRFTINAGEELVSGVYFLKVQTGSENAVQKVILLR